MNLVEVKLEFYMKSEEFDTPYIGVNGFPVEKNEEYLISHSQYMLIGRIEKINVGNNHLNC